MLHFISNEVVALLQVIMIDLVLAGDNAIVIGLAAAGLPLQQRTKAVLLGIIAATILRIMFAAATTQLLQVVGLVLAGGILMLWVSWKMFRELRLSAEGTGDAIEAMSIWTSMRTGQLQGMPRGNPLLRPQVRSSWRTYQCPSTMCWPLQAPRESISLF
jgi:predicted tellurium resistance membrane protein TerC